MGGDVLLDKSAIKASINNDQVKYAGLMVRFGASFIDGIIIFLLTLPFFLLSTILNFYGISWQLSGISVSGLAIALIVMAIYWLYSAWFESSAYMATPGKMAIGIMVTGMDGGRISFSRAARRYFFKSIIPSIVSLPDSILLLSVSIVYIIADVASIFTNLKRQSLHDRFAQTVVVHGKAEKAVKLIPDMNKTIVLALIGSILLSVLLVIIFIFVYFYVVDFDNSSEATPFTINGYVIGGANLVNSTSLTVNEKLAAINLTLASAEVNGLGYYNASDLSRSVGVVRRSNEPPVVNKYFTWSYTNLESGLLNNSLLLVNVPINYIDPATNTGLTMTLFVDLTNNRILGYERVKDPGTTDQRVTEVCCYIPANSGWYHELRGNYEYHSSSEIEGRFYRLGFKLECSPDDYRYLSSSILDTNGLQKLKTSGSMTPFYYGIGYTKNYDQVIDGSQSIPAQVVSSDVAVWNADMSFEPETELIMNSTVPCVYTLFIINNNPDKDIQIKFELVPH